MFPIIPYNLSSRTSFLQDCSSKTAKVVAVCDIPRDTSTEVLEGKDFAGKIDNHNLQLEVELNNEKLVLKTKKFSSKYHWIRFIRLADDCHSSNVKLCFQNTTEDPKNFNFILQITKPIKNGQELLLWFSEEILAHIQMAFLTPANIQGQKKYVCHQCGTTFEYPNPLKLHLTLNCNKEHMSALWDRLIKLTNTTKPETKNNFGFQLLKPNVKEKYSIINLSKMNEEKPSKLINLPLSTSINPIEIQRPFSEPATIHSSAFKPYLNKKPSQINNQIRLTQSMSNFATLPSNIQLTNHSPSFSSMIQTQTYQNAADFNHAAQMETLVSNLGKSKQGHLCIYCGKCYSRKYGLKIHIRTHTGYKPLKCKYCLRPFGDPSNLNKHVRLHAEGDTPYKCELCGKVLVRRRDLERHLRSRHMGEIQLEEKVDESINSSSDNSD